MFELENGIEAFVKPKRSKLSIAMFVVVLVILAALMVITQIFGFSKVIGSSMRNTILENDFLICSSVGDVKRGDIVTTVKKGEGPLVKRVIGMPGDRLLFKCDSTAYNPSNKVELYIDKGDGFVLEEEPFVYQDTMTEAGFSFEKMFMGIDPKYYIWHSPEEPNEDIEEKYIITLTDDQYFLMGDNRDHSTDSRNYGPFEREEIKGIVVSVVQPEDFFYVLLNGIYNFAGIFG